MAGQVEERNRTRLLYIDVIQRFNIVKDSLNNIEGLKCRKLNQSEPG